MFGKRCQLCGGKLDHNVCTLCGLDNSKTDANYKLNESSCDHEPLTHVHTENEPKRNKQQWSKPQQNGAKKVNVPQKAKTKKKGTSKVFILIIIIIFLINAFENMDFSLFNFGENFGTHEVWPDSETSCEEDNYAYVTRPLSEYGDGYKVDLEQGTYIVGVHIPEGDYKAIEREEVTFDGFYLEDSENSIYFGKNFHDDYNIETIDDIRCYTGAKLSVTGRVTFVTYHGQVSEVTAIDNPLTEPVSVQDGMVAGVDFPAGTYDIVMNDGNKSFAYIVPGTVWEDPETEEELVTERVWINTSGGEFVERNLYFPEGTKILIDEGEVNLVPSLKIPESYEGYYDIIE